MIKILLLTFLIFVYPASLKAQQQMVPYLDGIPVMHNFNVMQDSVLIFDKPEGKITETSLICSMQCPKQQDVIEYYNRAFASTGWARMAIGQYSKDHSWINIDYQTSKDQSTPAIITFHSKS